MKYLSYLLLFIVLAFVTKFSYSQDLEKIKTLILQSDSVILTSPISPPSLIAENDNSNDRQVVLNDKINPTLIKEQKTINGSSKKNLALFITKPFQDEKIEKTMCFTPHHTIYIFNKKTISWINICFSCEEIEYSNDIKFPEKDFDNATWKELESFFKSQGLNYGFNDV